MWVRLPVPKLDPKLDEEPPVGRMAVDELNNPVLPEEPEAKRLLLTSQSWLAASGREFCETKPWTQSTEMTSITLSKPLLEYILPSDGREEKGKIERTVNSKRYRKFLACLS